MDRGEPARASEAGVLVAARLVAANRSRVLKTKMLVAVYAGQAALFNVKED